MSATKSIKYLKIKIVSLMAEAQLIRREERRTRNHDVRAGLREHRVGIVRYEARHALIAYGFLRGRKYSEIEPRSSTTPDWDKVRKNVSGFGDRLADPTMMDRFEEWRVEHLRVAEAA